MVNKLSGYEHTLGVVLGEVLEQSAALNLGLLHPQRKACGRFSTNRSFSRRTAYHFAIFDIRTIDSTAANKLTSHTARSTGSPSRALAVLGDGNFALMLLLISRGNIPRWWVTYLSFN